MLKHRRPSNNNLRRWQDRRLRGAAPPQPITSTPPADFDDSPLNVDAIPDYGDFGYGEAYGSSWVDDIDIIAPIPAVPDSGSSWMEEIDIIPDTPAAPDSGNSWVDGIDFITPASPDSAGNSGLDGTDFISGIEDTDFIAPNSPEPDGGSWIDGIDFIAPNSSESDGGSGLEDIDFINPSSLDGTDFISGIEDTDFIGGSGADEAGAEPVFDMNVALNLGSFDLGLGKGKGKGDWYEKRPGKTSTKKLPDGVEYLPHLGLYRYVAYDDTGRAIERLAIKPPTANQLRKERSYFEQDKGLFGTGLLSKSKPLDVKETSLKDYQGPYHLDRNFWKPEDGKKPPDSNTPPNQPGLTPQPNTGAPVVLTPNPTAGKGSTNQPGLTPQPNTGTPVVLTPNPNAGKDSAKEGNRPSINMNDPQDTPVAGGTENTPQDESQEAPTAEAPQDESLTATGEESPQDKSLAATSEEVKKDGAPAPAAMEVKEQNSPLVQRDPVGMGIQGSRTTAQGITRPQDTFEFNWRIMSLDDIVPSHDQRTMQARSDYPADLQPRDRERSTSDMQVENIARNLSPLALLDDSHSLDLGAPIVGPDGVVESGSGRTMAVQRAHVKYPEKYKAYVEQLRQPEFLARVGLKTEDLEGIDKPILVRERSTELGEKERLSFAREANAPRTMTSSVTETAMSHAQAFSDQQIARLHIPESASTNDVLLSDNNRDITNGFLASYPPNERAGLADANGNLSKRGLDALRESLFARVYGNVEGGKALSQELQENVDEDILRVGNALISSLPNLARAEALVRSGQRKPEYSIAADISVAVQTLRRLKRQGVPVDHYMNSYTAMDEGMTPARKRILAYMDKNRNSGRKMTDFINNYAVFVAGQPAEGQGLMAGLEPEVVSKEDWIEKQTKTLEQERGLFDKDMTFRPQEESAAGFGKQRRQGL